jgi:bifunctional DNA-binding transcriptional regulator/antitoxin component of YhaV-PrlF toxin-antitoxin module
MGMAGVSLRAMTLRVEKAGRVTLPKPLRDRLGRTYDILQALNEDREDREHEILGL